MSGPKKVTLDVDRPGYTSGYQVSINVLDEDGCGGGTRLFGPKYLGDSTNVLRVPIDEALADDIRSELAQVFPDSRTEMWKAMALRLDAGWQAHPDPDESKWWEGEWRRGDEVEPMERGTVGHLRNLRKQAATSGSPKPLTPVVHVEAKGDVDQATIEQAVTAALQPRRHPSGDLTINALSDLVQSLWRAMPLSTSAADGFADDLPTIEAAALNASLGQSYGTRPGLGWDHGHPVANAIYVASPANEGEEPPAPDTWEADRG